MKEANNAVKISDLVFEAHQSWTKGYTASAITGSYNYSNDEYPYEIAVMQGGDLCYDTPIADDVLGYLTKNADNEILQQIAALPKR